MRRIKISEGGVTDPITSKVLFPLPPAAGVLDPSLMNHIQEEICNVIEGAGFQLDETKRNQLKTAIDVSQRITAAKVISVPTDFPTLQDALKSLEGKSIEGVKEVTIQIEAITNTSRMMSVPLYINLPYGSQVTIKGNPVAADFHRLYWNIAGFSNNQSCVTVENGSSIAFEGIAFFTNGINPATGVETSMIRASLGGYIRLSSCTIDGIVSAGIIAEDKGIINFDYLIVKNISTFGLTPRSGGASRLFGEACVSRREGHILGNNLSIENIDGVVSCHVESKGFINLKSSVLTKGISANTFGVFYGLGVSVTSGLSDCFEANYGGRMNLEVCSAQKSGVLTIHGYGAYMNSEINTYNCIAENCTVGFRARYGSRMSNELVISRLNGTAFAALQNSIITNNNVTQSGNTLDYSPIIGSTDATDLSRIYNV